MKIEVYKKLKKALQPRDAQKKCLRTKQMKARVVLKLQ